MEHGSGNIGAPFVILLVLVLFYCCCCCCCADTTTLVSADAAAELKAEREEDELEGEQEEGAASFHIVGGGRRLLVGSDDGEGRGDLFAELNVLAKEIGKEILAVRKAEEGITEEGTAGDGELNQRIMRFRFTEEENSAAPAVCYPPPPSLLLSVVALIIFLSFSISGLVLVCSRGGSSSILLPLTVAKLFSLPRFTSPGVAFFPKASNRFVKHLASCQSTPITRMNRLIFLGMLIDR